MPFVDAWISCKSDVAAISAPGNATRLRAVRIWPRITAGRAARQRYPISARSVFDDVSRAIDNGGV